MACKTGLYACAVKGVELYAHAQQQLALAPDPDSCLESGLVRSQLTVVSATSDNATSDHKTRLCCVVIPDF